MKPRFVFVVIVTVLIGTACSSGSTTLKSATSKPTTPAAPTAAPAGPAARVVGRLRGGNGISLPSGAGTPLPTRGWVEDEFAVEGTASSYRSDTELPTDGRFTLTEDTTADYRTRIVVRRPATPATFNGAVVVEWLNVSGGLDAGPDFTYASSELVRGGYAWVGVSAQRIGIEGGPVAVPIAAAIAAGAGKGLRANDPARYGGLRHPGDAFSYDMFTQVARSLRAPKASNLLGPLRPDHILAIGESQSAFALTTYVNGVQPITRAFDGFLIHSRGGAAAPLGVPDAGIDIAGTVGGKPTMLRTDLLAPILVVETETDLLGFLNNYPARQPDTAKIRQWEMAGTAHADAYLIGAIADQIGCPTPTNAGPGHFIVSAALHRLNTWVRDGTPPPTAPRLEIDATPAFVRDEVGNVRGGIRTPLVDAPVDTLSGEAAGGSVACLLFGSTTPLSAEQLNARYPTRQAYLDAYREATDVAIKAGFVLAADRADLLKAANPNRIAP